MPRSSGGLGRLALGALLVLLAASGVAACTGSEDDQAEQEAGDSGDAGDAAGDASDAGSDGSPEAFAAEYRAAADRYAEALEELQAGGAAAVAEDPVGAHEVYADLQAVTEAARDDFESLQPPAELADDLDGLLANFAAQISTLADAVEGARERDDRAVQRDLEDYADQLSVWRERHAELSNMLADA